MRSLILIPPVLIICGLLGGLCKSVTAKEKPDAASLYIEGTLLFLCIAGLTAMPVIKLKSSFSAYQALFWVCLVFCCVLGGLLWYRRFRFRVVIDTKRPDLTHLAAVLAFLLSAAGIFLYEPSVGADLTAETVYTTIGTDSIFEYNPATGRELELGIYPQSKLQILPILYSLLFRLGGGSLSFFLYRLVPLAVLLLNFTVMWRMSGVLFDRAQEKRVQKRGLFLLFYAALVWFGDYLSFTFSYLLLHEAWKGEAILAVVLLPYLICLCMEMMEQGRSMERFVGICLCALAGIFCAPWKLAAALEGLTLLLFGLIGMTGRVWQWLKLRRS